MRLRSGFLTNFAEVMEQVRQAFMYSAAKLLFMNFGYCWSDDNLSNLDAKQCLQEFATTLSQSGFEHISVADVTQFFGMTSVVLFLAFLVFIVYYHFSKSRSKNGRKTKV